MTTDKELDLDRFVDMFDTAMNSDNPTVKKCFNNLLIVIALAHAENNEVEKGPLRTLVDQVEHLTTRIIDLERSILIMRDASGPAGTPYTFSTSTPYTSTSIWMGGGGYVSPNSGATSITSPFSASTIGNA